MIRCDNEPKYIGAALQNWANRRGIRIEYIQPGNPQQNAYVERFNRTVRYEWLAQYLFDTVGEVQDSATRWLWNHNHERSNMALGGFDLKQRLAMAAWLLPLPTVKNGGLPNQCLPDHNRRSIASHAQRLCT